MIKADVSYDKKALGDLMRFSAVNRSWKWAIYIAILLFSIILMICNIGNDFFPFSIILLVLVCVVDFLAVFAYFINPIIKLKSFTEDNVVINHFSFEDNVIKLSSESKVRKGSSELAYSSFVKVDESPTTFYLFVSKTGALIVTKSGISGGNEDDLRKLLISKIPNKKINKLSAK